MIGRAVLKEGSKVVHFGPSDSLELLEEFEVVELLRHGAFIVGAYVNLPEGKTFLSYIPEFGGGVLINFQTDQHYGIVDRDSWRSLGEYYGYPKCCIDNFCEEDPTKKYFPPLEIHNNTGFIPCEKCTEAAAALQKAGYTPTEALATFISNRLHSEVFPSHEQTDRQLGKEGAGKRL